VEEMIPLVAILSIFVILPGMAMFFADRRRRWRHENQTQSTNSAQLTALAERMERRIDALEQILDTESPGWRKKYHEHP
jgi:phage shock protein B